MKGFVVAGLEVGDSFVISHLLFPHDSFSHSHALIVNSLCVMTPFYWVATFVYRATICEARYISKCRRRVPVVEIYATRATGFRVRNMKLTRRPDDTPAVRG